MSKDTLKETVAELETVRRKGVVQSTKDSLAGWAEMIGMSRLVSGVVDTITCAVGYAVATNFTGGVGAAGYALLAIGAFGLLHKAIKQVMGR